MECLRGSYFLTVTERMEAGFEGSSTDLTFTTAMYQISYYIGRIKKACPISKCVHISNLEKYMCMQHHNFHKLQSGQGTNRSCRGHLILNLCGSSPNENKGANNLSRTHSLRTAHNTCQAMSSALHPSETYNRSLERADSTCRKKLYVEGLWMGASSVYSHFTNCNTLSN